MAGHIPRRVLQKPEVHKCLLNGTTLFKSDEGDAAIQKLKFFADKDAYFLWAKGTDVNKTDENFIWDIQLISDVRSGKPPKVKDDGNEDLYLTLVYRVDGIVNLEYTHLLAQSPEMADTFKKAVNALTVNMLHAHAAPQSFLKKHYLRIKLHANGKGEIALKSICKLMMMRYSANNFLNQWLAQFRIVKESEDGKNKYVMVDDFTEDLFFKMVDQILNNRSNAIDVVFSSLTTKSKKTPQLTLKEFHTFLNSQQRDPRLNEILYPFTSKDNAGKIIAKYENGKSERLSSKGLMEYLMSEENNILDLEHLNQTHDMGQPLSHYFINSSHNTYLTGHQLRSNSTTEMYIQCLLLGCRCVELDCWPENDNIIITHGGTFCGKVAFEEVVAAIAEFAFVTSEYPLILSIENHCRRHPHLMQHMANTFRTFFGDKLMSQPLEDYPLDRGVMLPPPEKLKNKILIKDKVRKKGDATLQRGASINLEPITEEPKKPSRDVDSPLAPVSEEPDSTTKADPISSENESEDSKLGGGEDTTTAPSGGEKASDSQSEAGPIEMKSSASPSGEGTSSPGGKESPDGGKESSGNTSPTGDKEEDDLFPVQRTYGPDGPDITTINVALIHQRTSEEGIMAGPLAEIINYTTGVTFEGFATSERTKCNYHMSSFVEEKGLNHIKNKPKDFVKYNMRQLSRIYPQGARINSSNYMPIIYWNVGCQMVALNFQTSDVPVQMNSAKFEFNGNTGFLHKPWVMSREGAAKGVFNPFVQSKLEDIVPAKLKVKVIAGYFLTPADKQTRCYVEVDLYGLPADTVRHKYYTKRVAGPHPFWNEDYFTFKRVLLPEMALLRIGVFDEDKEMIGMRVMPLNAIRPGFRHVNLRDKHNSPLPMELLLVQIQVEDWVPDEMEDVVAMLMDPISFANRALQEMSEGLDESEAEFTKLQKGLSGAESETDGSKEKEEKPKPPSKSASLPGNLKDAPSSLIPPQLGTAYDSSSLQRPKPKAQPNYFGESLPCLDVAKERPEPVAIQQDSKEVMGHQDFKKLDKKHSQLRLGIQKKQEKALKVLKEKVSKGKAEESEVAKMMAAHKVEVINFNKTCSSERYERKRSIIEAAHRNQLKELREKIHKNDRAAMSKELGAMMKKQKSETNMKDNYKQSKQEIEDRAISIGKKCRNEFDRLHSVEAGRLEDSQKRAIEELVKIQAKELDELNRELSELESSSSATPL